MLAVYGDNHLDSDILVDAVPLLDKGSLSLSTCAHICLDGPV